MERSAFGLITIGASVKKIHFFFVWSLEHPSSTCMKTLIHFDEVKDVL